MNYCAVVDSYSLTGGIFFFKIMDLTKIEKISSINTITGQFKSLILSKISQSIGYILDRGLIIYNFSGYAIKPVSYYSINSGSYQSLALNFDETIAYITDSDSGKGLIVLNISDKSIPSLIKRYPIESSNLYQIFMTTDFSYLYITDNKFGSGLFVMDVRDYNNISIIGRYNTSARNYKSILLSQNEDTAFITDSSPGAGLIILNTTNKKAINLIGIYKINAGKYNSLALSKNGNTLFITDSSSGKGLTILDITNKKVPKLLSIYKTNAGYYDSLYLSQNEDLVYIADMLRVCIGTCQGNGFSILNVVDLKNPELVGSFSSFAPNYISGTIEDVKLLKDSKTLITLDSTGTQNVIIFGIDFTTRNNPIALSSDGNYILSSVCSSKTKIYNIENPTSNFYLGTIPLGSCYSSIYVKPDNSIAIVQSDSGLLYQYDISSFENPQLLSSYTSSLSNKDFAANPNFDTIFVVTSNGFVLVFDVSNPSAISQLTTIQTQGRSYNSITLSKNGKIAFITDEYSPEFANSIGLIIMDVSSRTNLKRLSTYSDPFTYRYRSVSLDQNDSIAFICDYGYGNGITILNISNLSNPTLISRYNTNAGYYSSSTITLDQKYLLITDNQKGFGLVVLNLTDIENPVLVKRIYTAGCQYQKVKLSINGTYAFVHDESSATTGFVVIDLSFLTSPENNISNSANSTNSTSPNVTNSSISEPLTSSNLLNNYGFLNIIQTIPVRNGQTLEVSPDGNTLYVANYDGGKITIFDITVKENPVQISELTISRGESLYATDGMVYVADSVDGLYIIDVSSPSYPSIIGTFSGINFNKITLDEDRKIIYLADSSGICKIIDVSNPNAPIKYILPHHLH